MRYMQALTQAVVTVATAGLALLSSYATSAPMDFDGSGMSDIFWRNVATGENYVYFMNASSIANEGRVRTVADLKWKIVAIGDFNGDGKSDILWRNGATGENYVYLMDGLSIANEGYLRTVADLNWKIVGVGDFNGDGKSDILWRNSVTGENYIYFLDGTTIASEGYIRSVPLGWSIAGIGDFNGDSRSDILWRNGATGQNYVYFMDALSIATEGYLRTVADPNWKIVGIGDFNADGTSDILWRNVGTGENYLYPMNGLHILTGEGYLRSVPDAAWQIVGTGDYDGDGRSDILWRNESTGEHYLYPMVGTDIKVTEGYVRKVTDLNWRPTPAPITAHLAWDAVIAPNLGGYRVYYGTGPRAYVQALQGGFNVGNVTTFTVVGLSRATKYYFAVTAYDTSGNESPYSNEVSMDLQ